MDFDEVSYTFIEKAKLKSLKDKNRRLICMSNASLYVSDRYCNWRNLKLNGFLTFEIDYKLKTRYISLYEMDNFEQLFQYELYLNFENYLLMCESNFLCFEIDGGFIGIQFIYDNEAISFKILVSKYTQNFVLKMIDKKSYDFSADNYALNFNQTRKKILLELYIDVIKNKYKESSLISEEEMKRQLSDNINPNTGKTELDEYFENKSNAQNLFYIFGEVFFKKIKNLNFLLKITFDPKIKKFNIDNIPQEMKKALNKMGIKKHQFNDTQFALNIFKNFIEKYDKNNTGYMNFFGRLISSQRHRKALDFVGIIRKKKLNETNKSKHEVNNEDKICDQENENSLDFYQPKK